MSELKLDSINECSKRVKRVFMNEVMNDIENNLYNGVGLILFKIYFYSFPVDFKNKVLSKNGDLYSRKDKQMERIIKNNKR